jgi:D-sedoheptulose 7-phosphate isomerase
MEMQINEQIDWINGQIGDHETMLASVKNHVPTLQRLADIMVGCLEGGGKIIFCGNGGSAADAQHWAAELSGRFFFDRPSLAGLSLTTNTSEITAIGNDYGYEFVFSRPLSGIGRKGDVLIGISTSGNSLNVIRAFEKAQEMGIITVGFTGGQGGKMVDASDIMVRIDAPNTARIQEGHELCAHILFGLIEKRMFG